MQPRRKRRFGIGLKKAIEEGGVGLWAEARRRDQHQRQRLDARLMRERGGDRAAERVADEMRRVDALLDERGARRSDQSLEACFLAERRESVARQVDRQRRLGLGQKPMNGAPAVEIGAEAVQEHDRRALPSRQPQTMHVRGGRQQRRAAQRRAAGRAREGRSRLRSRAASRAPAPFVGRRACARRVVRALRPHPDRSPRGERGRCVAA